jgi:hypothetical protein
MIALVVGIANLLIGTAYAGLGLLSAWEAATQYRYRGLSRFGVGFSLMAASCGPHHLVHGWSVLHGGAVSAPMLAITLIGVPGGAVFCWLRAEAMLRGQGDRTLAVTSQRMAAGVVAWLGTVGALAGGSLATSVLPTQVLCSARSLLSSTAGEGGGVDLALLVSVANLLVTVTYAMVGWYLAETQVRRYIASHAWSLSGLSLAAVFPTCAAMHLILALASRPDTATLPFDLLGVPASIYFLWVVKRLHMDSVVDWNRRPLLGIAAIPKRSAPWNDRSASRA